MRFCPTSTRDTRVMSDFTDVLAFHRFLLYDTGGRLNAFRQALEAALRPNSVVLDLGAGTGILSLIAARAGARRVFAVERNESASYAEEVIAANGLAQTITVIRGDVRSIVLPEPADVMVTDVFGSFGLRPGGLAAVMDARDRLLRPGSRLIPETVTLFVAPAEANDAWQQCVGAWETDVAGIRMSALRERAANGRYHVCLEKPHLLGPAVRLAELSLTNIRDSTLHHEAVLRVTRAGTLRGVCGWFAASLGSGLSLTNEPGANDVNYAQSLLPLARPMAVGPADSVSLSLDHRDNELLRWRGVVRREDGALSDATFDHCTFLGGPLSKASMSADPID